MDTSASDSRETAPRTTHQLQDSERSPPPPPPAPCPLPPVQGLMVVGEARALVWARPVVMPDPLEVASTRDVWSIDKAGEK